MLYTSVQNADNTISACERKYSNGLENDYSEIHRHQVKLQEENSCFAEHFIVRLKEV